MADVREQGPEQEPGAEQAGAEAETLPDESREGDPVPAEEAPAPVVGEACEEPVPIEVEDLGLVRFELELDERVNYALQQNDVPVVKAMRLENLAETPLEEIRVVLRLDPGPGEPSEDLVGRIEPGATYNLRPHFGLPPARLAGLSERERCELVVEAWRDGALLGRDRFPLTLLAWNEWGGLGSLPESLAAFVLPNHPALAPVLRRAGELLGEATGSPSLDGYQSRDPARVEAMAGALYQAIQEQDLTYVNPPASFETEGQKVQLPDRVLSERLATCLDVSVLYAACLERVGLHSLLVLVEGHALAGVWLEPTTFPEVLLEGEPAVLRKRQRLGALQVCEITAVTARPSLDYPSAVAAGLERLGDPGETFVVIDVAAARAQRLLPLPVRVEAGAEGQASDSVMVVSRLTPVPGGLPGLDQAREGPGGALGTRLDRWKSRLLDLSYRNKLLNYRPGKRSVELLVPAVSRLEDALVAGKVFLVESLGGGRRRGRSRDRGSSPERSGEDLRQAEVVELFGKGTLPVAMEKDPLANRLTEIYRDYRRGLEESGANTLYLSLGMLEYYESPSSQTMRRAPVLLLPVEIQRLSAGKGFRLQRTDEDGRFNLTLLEKLRADFRIEVEGLDPLPEDESGLDVPLIFRRLREAVLEKERWELKEEVHLATFSFTKFLMWKDLEDRASALMESPVVHHLVETPQEDFRQEGSFPELASLDTERSPRDTLCPLDADSSQLRAVFSAVDGQSFVLEGPPGTGKSQTITNMISQALAAGRTVLFVAEKRAALEVVYKRLSRVGLDPFCLELHSNKVQKRHVLEQLQRSLDATGLDEPADWEKDAAKLEEERARLAEVVQALHQPRELGVSLYQATSRSLALAELPEVKLGSALDGVLEDSLVQDWRAQVGRLQELCAEVGDPREHPWRAATLSHWVPRTTSRAEDTLEDLRGCQDDLAEFLPEIRNCLGLLEEDRPRGETVALVRLVALLADPPDPAPSLLEAEGWELREKELREWVEQGLQLTTLRGVLEVRFRVEELFALDLHGLHGKYERWSGAFFLLRFLMLLTSSWKIAATRQPGQAAGRAPEVERELASALEVQVLEERLADARGRLEELLGRPLGAGTLDWGRLAEQLEWAAEVHRLVAEVAAEDRGALHLRVAELALQHGEGTLQERFARCAKSLGETWERLEAARDAIGRELGAAPWELFEDESPEPFAGHLASWLKTHERGIDELESWCAYVEAREKVGALGLEGLVAALGAGEVAGERLVDALDKGVYQRWLEAVLEREELLRRFRGESHQRRITRFQELDREHLAASARVVASRLSAKVPKGASGSQTSELGILRRELQKKRRHKPIRRLLEEIPNLLPRLCPCLLMSPLSVAQYLDPSAPGFDLVVFDEASQIPVWDAIGSLARGQQSVVVGDPKQLPPTSFFQRGDAEDEDEPEEEVVEDLESILDECLAAGLPRITLDWHYRSRHESLIAFSNHRYYERRLLTFPSAVHQARGLGVSWQHVPEGFYDSGAGRVNRAEAEAVVAEVVARLRDPAQRDRSIGVVTFSSSQQALIEGLLDKARRRHREIERYFGDEVEEPVFVKNLENVQGDERCVMLFSICYGPDENGRVYMRFGPLNREGGERRLNVAITRAREELVVFSTLRPDQIDLSRVRWPGVGDLKVFLDYAARGSRAISEAVHGGSGGREAPFEELVADFLEAEGWQVERHVGCSGYRIDLGVVHPDDPGRFLLGIECDGAGYRDAVTARDRDRLRQEVLEGLGWTMHRIWSTDWWKHARRERKRLLELLAECLEARRRRDREEAEAAAAFAARVEAGDYDVPSDSDPEAEGESDPEGEPEEEAAESASEDPPGAGADPGEAEDREDRIYQPWPGPGEPAPADGFLVRTHTRLLQKHVRELVAHEAPVAEALALQRLLPVWGVKRASKKVQARFEEILSGLERGGSLKRRDGILWGKDQDPGEYEGYRLPGADPESERKAEHLPPEEVANALEEVLAREVGLPEEELLKVVARHLGYARLGARVRASMEAGLERAAPRGRLHREDGDVTWVAHGPTNE